MLRSLVGSEMCIRDSSYDWMGIETGTNEISNIDVTLNYDDHIQDWKEQIRVAASAVFDLAQTALATNPDLRKVILMKRIPRHDDKIRSQLTKYGNSVYDQIWEELGSPSSIVIGEPNLDCYGDLKDLRYGVSGSQVCDNIHLRGKLGPAHLTNSIIKTFKLAFPFLQSLTTEAPVKSNSYSNRSNVSSSTSYQPREQREGNGRRYRRHQQSSTNSPRPSGPQVPGQSRVKQVNPWQPFLLPLYNRFAGLSNI